MFCTDTSPSTQSMAPAAELSEIMGESTWSPTQIFVVLLIACSIIFDGFDNQVLGLTLPALIQEWNLQKSAFSPILSLGLIGMTCGAAIAGPIGDKIGRRNALAGSVVLFGMVTALSCFVNSLITLGAARFIAALGLGGAMPNAIAMISEFTPRKVRALTISLVAVCIPLGGFIGGIIAAVVLPIAGWRVLFFIAGIVPAILGLVLMVLLPQSPAQLLKKGHITALRKLLVSMKIMIPTGTKITDQQQNEHSDGISALWSDGLRRNTVALCASFFVCLLSVYACFNWLPMLMAQQGHDLATASLALTMFNLGGVIAALVGGWTMDRFGSRLPLSLMSCLTILTAATLGLVPLQGIPLLLALAVLGAGIAGTQSVLTALAAHVYPTRMRASGVGISIGFGRIGGVVSAFVGAYALTLGGGPAFFGLMAIAGLATLIALNVVTRHSQRPGLLPIEIGPVCPN